MAAFCHSLLWSCNLWFLYKLQPEGPRPYSPPVPFELREAGDSASTCYNDNLDLDLVKLLDEAEGEVVVFSSVKV